MKEKASSKDSDPNRKLSTEIQKVVRKTKISLPNKLKLPQGLSLPVTAAQSISIPSSATVKVQNISVLKGKT